MDTPVEQVTSPGLEALGNLDDTIYGMLCRRVDANDIADVLAELRTAIDLVEKDLAPKPEPVTLMPDQRWDAFIQHHAEKHGFIDKQGKITMLNLIGSIKAFKQSFVESMSDK